MLLCTACQRDNPDGARFCNGCGSPLPVDCPTCGRSNPADAAFCNGCGARLLAGPAALPSAPRSYTPPHLAERILRSRSALEGERKQVTVVFCDLADSTEVSAKLGPETMHEVMDRCIRLILAQVHRYEGTVNQFLGDGVMALFGAPLALEDAPRRAVVAALAIQRALVPLRRELSTRFAVEFRMRIGINSGPVVVGRIGDDLRMDYTAVGDTTNLADRLQKQAPPGGVLISDSTRRAILGWFELRDVGELTVKGKDEPVRAFEALAERDVTDRVALAAEETALTPLVGRERELAVLMDAFSEARAGRGQVAFVVGEAGLGKSRLLHEFRQRLSSEDCVWFEGRCTSYGRNVAFHPIADCLRRVFGLTERDDEGTASARLEATEGNAGGELAWTLPFLRRLLSLPSGDPTVDALDAVTRRSETFRALRERMLRATERSVFVLVIEDLHWIDTASEEFLEYLIESVPGTRALVLLTHRPGYRHPFGDRSFHQRLSLQTLGEDQMARMAEGVLRGAPVPEALRRLVASKAEGNPFFVEEVLRSLLEDGSLRRVGDEVELACDPEDLRIPDRIQDVLMARLDRLDDGAKRALQVASVIGREFALRLLERIHEASATLGRVVEDLRDLELIYEKSHRPELAYMFKHALTHEVAYESVLASRRRVLHRVVADAIEELYRDRLSEHYETLARHYTEAEAWERAFYYRECSSEKAAAAFANQAAAEHCRAALALADQVGAAVAPERLRTLLERLGSVLFCLSEFTASGDAFERAVSFGGSPDERGVDLSRAAHSRLWGHEYERGGELIQEVLALSRAHAAPRAKVYSELVDGFGRSIFGDFSRTQELSGVALQLGSDDPELRATGCLLVGEWADWRGDWRVALAQEAEAMAIARANQMPVILMIAGWFHGKALCGLGDYRGALDSLREALAVCERSGDRAQRSRLLNTLGWLHAEVGDHEGALAFNQRSAEIAFEMVELKLVASAAEVWANASINQAGDHIALGELEEAGALLARLRAHIESETDPWMMWRYRLHLTDAEARLALARAAPDDALRLARQELAGARQHGARKLEARAQELGARALLVLGRRAEAEVELREAAAIAAAIGYAPVRWRALALSSELARQAGDVGRAERSASATRALTAEFASALPDPHLRRTLTVLGERLAADPLGARR